VRVPLNKVFKENKMSTVERLRRIILNMAATRPGMRTFYLFVRMIDIPISRLTKGAFIPSANWNIMPIIYLTTTGARSGISRSSPVLCIPDGRNLILVGSNWGNPKNPSWAYNLRTNPHTQVRRGKLTQGLTAREVHGEERAAYWQKAVRFYPPYVSYEQRAGRSLPIFLLEP
jgi:deazaflavin-dependent oxidoreductase (nitroreductase family)